MPKRFTRRQILGAASTGLLATKGARPAASSDKPAILGGRPVRTAPFPSWPVIAENDERAWTEVLHKGKWNRLDSDYARQFEETWAATLGRQTLPGDCQRHERALHFTQRPRHRAW